MVSEPPPRPSTPPERSSSPPPGAPPPPAPLSAGALTDVDAPSEPGEGERISVEPGSRPGMLPPKSSSAPAVAASVSPLPKRSGRLGLGGDRQGPGGTIRMSAGDLPANRLSPGRASLDRASLDGGRKSRLSVLRESILSRLPSIPISRVAQSGPLGILALVLAGAVAVVVVMWSTGRMPAGLASVLHLQPKRDDALKPPPLPAIEVAVDESPFPVLSRGRAPMSGGVLYIPSSFTASSDGSFDLVVHFHGNTDLVTESYQTAQLDAVVAVMNLGIGSGKYEDRFENPAALAEVLVRTADALKERGLPHPKLRRLALVAWSAGYGAVVRILEHPADAEKVDAVILLDGLHTSYREGTHDVEEAKIASVERFAERAKRGERLFVVTHSDIEPVGYLGVHETMDFLLGRIGVERHAASGMTELPHLASMEGVLPKDELKPLVLTSEAHEGNVWVSGYAGNEAATHIAHLVQMSQLALPRLAKRWQ